MLYLFSLRLRMLYRLSYHHRLPELPYWFARIVQVIVVLLYSSLPFIIHVSKCLPQQLQSEEPSITKHRTPISLKCVLSKTWTCVCIIRKQRVLNIHSEKRSAFDLPATLCLSKESFHSSKYDSGFAPRLTWLHQPRKKPRNSYKRANYFH